MMVNTTLCYIEKNGCYLMLHRTKKQGDYNGGKWIGIGGKFEPGESPEDCAVREISEETGLAVLPQDLEYRGIVTFVDLTGAETQGKKIISYSEIMHIFRARRFSGEVRGDCDEGELEWVPITKMTALPHWKGDEIFLDFLSLDKPFFSLKLIYRDGSLIETYLGGRRYEHDWKN